MVRTDPTGLADDEICCVQVFGMTQGKYSDSELGCRGQHTVLAKYRNYGKKRGKKCCCHCCELQQHLKVGPTIYAPHGVQIDSWDGQIIVYNNAWTAEDTSKGEQDDSTKCYKHIEDRPGLGPPLQAGVTRTFDLLVRVRVWDTCRGVLAYDTQAYTKRLYIHGNTPGNRYQYHREVTGP
jgi:hypothetical protein